MAADDVGHPVIRVMHRGVGRIVERARVSQRMHIVVVAQARVTRQADCHRLRPAAHGGEGDIDVNNEVAFRGPPVDFHVLTVRCGAQVD
jgi:hypothetical protein